MSSPENRINKMGVNNKQFCARVEASIHVVLHSHFHNRESRLTVDLVLGTIEFDKGNNGHALISLPATLGIS